MIETKFLPGRVRSATEPGFLSSATSYYVPRYVRDLVRHKQWRTPETIQRAYEFRYDVILKRLRNNELDFETFVLGDDRDDEFALVDDRILYGKYQRIVRRRVLDELERRLCMSCAKGTVIEFGSGSGRNLLWLKSRYPSVYMVGLELSKTGVDLSRIAAHRFGLEVEFHQANIADELPVLPRKDVSTFSVHCLEMMPRIFKRAVENILRTAENRVVFLEPVVELYPANLRGVISRLRVAQIDRLMGLPDYLKRVGCQIEIAERLHSASNPLNETCVIVVDRTDQSGNHQYGKAKPQ